MPSPQFHKGFPRPDGRGFWVVGTRRSAYDFSVPFGPGTIVDAKYRVERELGRGGMGVVFAATHLALGTKVALKFLNDRSAANPTILERFLREARAAAHMRSEHICQVLDVSEYDGRAYLVMELLEGIDLAELTRKTPLDVATTADYVRQACTGLAVAHARSIVHRDLKPENLYLTKRENGSSLVKVVDFGVAKTPGPIPLTGSLQLLGSPAYCSPEQLISSRDADARSDIWALGVIMYRLVSGKLPFDKPNLAELGL